MKVETTHEGTISLTINQEDGKTTTGISMNFETLGKDFPHLIPALYDLLKKLHQDYSLLNGITIRK